MAEVTISDSGAHGSAEGTDRIPASKGGSKGYLTPAQLLAYVEANLEVGGGGEGTVTSVGLSVPTGLQVANSPVTEAGTIAVTYQSGYQGYTGAEASKLSGIASGATVNSSDATLLARTNHTGEQAISTVTGLQTALDGKAASSHNHDGTYQPLDSDLTSIAGLSTTAAGRSVLTVTDPNADRMMAWDDSIGAIVPIALADIAAEESPEAGDFVIGYTAGGALVKISWDDLPGVGEGSGTVTSVGISLPTGLEATGSPITTSGTLAVSWSSGYQGYTSAEASKLSGIEAGADVTDATNVASAGALMSSGLGSVTQAYDADLAAIAGLSPSNDDILQRKSGAWTNRSIAQLLTDLGLGAIYQPLDADLTALAGLTSAADKVPYFTGSNAAAVADFTGVARTLIGQTTIPNMRATGLKIITISEASYEALDPPDSDALYFITDAE